MSNYKVYLSIVLSCHYSFPLGTSLFDLHCQKQKSTIKSYVQNIQLTLHLHIAVSRNIVFQSCGYNFFWHKLASLNSLCIKYDFRLLALVYTTPKTKDTLRYAQTLFLSDFIIFSSFIAFWMSPLIFSLPIMKAVVGFSLPAKDYTLDSNPVIYQYKRFWDCRHNHRLCRYFKMVGMWDGCLHRLLENEA